MRLTQPSPVSGYVQRGTVLLSPPLVRCSIVTGVFLAPMARSIASGVARERGSDHSPAESHSAFMPHRSRVERRTSIRSAGVGGRALLRRAVPIDGPDAIAWSRRLAVEEGIFTGISGGATFAAAVKIAEREPEGAVICCMLPDTGKRYLSTPLFDGIATEMTADQEALSRSTPGYQVGFGAVRAQSRGPHGQERSQRPAYRKRPPLERLAPRVRGVGRFRGLWDSAMRSGRCGNRRKEQSVVHVRRGFLALVAHLRPQCP